MPRLTPADLDALEAAHKAATPICGAKLTSHHIVSKGYEHLANLCRENMGPIAMTYKEESDVIAAAYTALPLLIAAARLTVPEVIGEKHRDGNWWMVWFPRGKQWYKARWDGAYQWWQVAQDAVMPYEATHALPMPGALDA